MQSYECARPKSYIIEKRVVFLENKIGPLAISAHQRRMAQEDEGRVGVQQEESLDQVVVRTCRGGEPGYTGEL